MSDSAMTDAAPSPSPSPSPAGGATSVPSGSFSLTPLYGFEGEGGGALCSVLRVDDCTILLDLGWDERYSLDQLAALKRVIPEVDAVLITHPDLAHLGALPIAIGQLGLTAPVYCTLPVWRNGQMFMYDAFQAVHAVDTQTPFTLDDVDKAFDQMRQLKYSETVQLTGRGAGVDITPSCAGHMLGGAFWSIKKDVESVIYAVDFNHAAERHLNGALLNAPQLHRPSALITDATNMLATSAKRSAQDATLTQTISERLRAGGSVLMPVDAAGRVLELLLVIHGWWATQQTMHNAYTLAFLSSQSGNTVDFARSQLEWMTDKCRKMFDTHKINPFALPHLRTITTRAQMEALLAEGRPVCLLASNSSLETGLSQDAFCAMAADRRNLLLFTQRAPTWSVAGQFFDPTPNGLKPMIPREVTFERRRRVLLEGLELDQYRAEQKIAREQSALESEKNAMADDADEDEDIEMSGKTDVGHRQKAKQLFPLFPFSETKRNFDVWGEMLTPEELRVISGATATAPATTAAAAAAYAKSKQQARLDEMKDVTEGAMEEEEEEQPAKTVREMVTMPLACQMQYVDFSGRSDGRAIRLLLKDMAPRKVLVLAGTAAAKNHLKSLCVSSEICLDVSLPAANQTVSVTSESNVYRVNLKDTLLHSLQFVQVSDEYEIAYVEGAVELNYQQANLPLLQASANHKGHAAVFLGQVRPAELQQILQNDGIEVDLVDGVLVCAEGKVNVRKINELQISIQGALCDEYFRIRDLLYGQYQIV